MIERIEECRKRGIWLEIITTGYDQPRAAEGYHAKARWSGGSTVLHVAFTLEEAVAHALDDAEKRRQ